jgi:hypothetical protein
MNMIRHQAIGPDLYPALCAPLRHELPIALIIIIAEENLLSAIPPLGNMVRYTGRNNSGQSGHV